MRQKIGTIQKKILLLLLLIPATGLAYSPRQRAKIFRKFGEEWDKINETALSRAIKGLYENRMIDFQEHKSGKIRITLLNDGKKKALEYDLENLALKKPKRWDGKWRMILFDIPNTKSKAREAIRYHLKRLGFYRYQKSIFVHPYPCRDELDFVIELYGIRLHVRYIVAEEIDNDIHLRKVFRALIA